jgi:hypothetical protein
MLKVVSRVAIGEEDASISRKAANLAWAEFCVFRETYRRRLNLTGEGVWARTNSSTIWFTGRFGGSNSTNLTVAHGIGP